MEDLGRLPAGRRARRVAPRAARAKLLSRAAAARAVARARRSGERVVFTNGCFDLLHVGHLRSLEAARRLGDRLLVAVNGDASVALLKGLGRPVVPARQRAELLAGLACVDWVVVFPEATPLELIRRLRPDVLAKGGEWARRAIVGGAEVLGWGGRVARLRVVPGVRTTRILERAARQARSGRGRRA